MSKQERRRSARIPVFQEEAAVILAGGRELPAKIVDLSNSGALVNLLDMPALGSREFAPDERVELSMQNEGSVFHVVSRVVRTGPRFIAVEFVDEKADVRTKLQQKLSLFQSRNTASSLKAKL